MMTCSSSNYSEICVPILSQIVRSSDKFNIRKCENVLYKYYSVEIYALCVLLHWIFYWNKMENQRVTVKCDERFVGKVLCVNCISYFSCFISHFAKKVSWIHLSVNKSSEFARLTFLNNCRIFNTKKNKNPIIFHTKVCCYADKIEVIDTKK